MLHPHPLAGLAVKAVVLFSGGLFSAPAVAQFDALPDADATWAVTTWVGPGYPFLGDLYTYGATSPDTVIDGEVFKKLFQTASYGGLIGPEVYCGALRDNEQGQVLFRSATDMTTILLYDFDVEAGDTAEVTVPLFGSTGMEVLSVDTIEVNGTPRKRVGVRSLGSPGGPDSYWIQGIGGTGGLFQTCGCLSVSGTSELVCMTAGGIVQYGGDVGGSGSCDTHLGVATNAAMPNTLRAAYDATSGSLLLLGGPQGPCTAEVIGMQGTRMSVQAQVRDRMDVTRLPTGVYVLRLFHPDGGEQRVRFVRP